jgi:endonuclease/exonuclease/phosphatase family metal-dependent hydrolase
MNILTYNICWQAMSSVAAGSTPLLGEKCIKHADGTTTCMRNLIDFIEDHDHIKFDIIGFQEANKYKTIIKHSNTLKTLNYLVHRSGPEDIVTFYNPKFKLEVMANGEFQSGRPFHLLVFNKAVVINLHNGHTLDMNEVEKYTSKAFDNLEYYKSSSTNSIHSKSKGKLSKKLKRRLGKISLSKSVDILESILNKERPLIVLGDFNLKDYKRDVVMYPFKYSSILDPLKSSKVVVSAEKIVMSCCSNKSADKLYYTHSGDFILSSRDSTINHLPTGYSYSTLISDHLPVMATIT